MSDAATFADALVRAGSAQPFAAPQDGSIVTHGVPPEVVREYAACRMAKRPPEAIQRACLAAYCGAGSTILGDDPKRWPMTWFFLRAWLARCADLERRVRGIPTHHGNRGSEAHV